MHVMCRNRRSPSTGARTHAPGNSADALAHRCHIARIAVIQEVEETRVWAFITYPNPRPAENVVVR
jgi:hypothetical protein